MSDERYGRTEQSVMKIEGLSKCMVGGKNPKRGPQMFAFNTAVAVREHEETKESTAY
jgi:hypothetical protein